MKKLILLFSLLACLPLFSQVQVAPFVNPKVQFFNAGAPCSGCKLSTYAAGTTNPLTTYSDSLGTVPNANPVVLDSNGFATIYLTSQSYKLSLATSGGATIWTQDNVSWNNLASTLSALTVAGAGPVTINSATSATSGANQTGPQLQVGGNYWNGSSSAADLWSLQDVLGTGANPTSTLTLTHSGSSGTATMSLPTIGNNPTFSGNPAFTGNTSFATLNGIQVVGNGTNTTIQAAISAAGSTGAVLIPPGYTGTDSYSNPTGVPVEDYRPNNNGISIWSVLQPSSPVANFPLGNDLALHAAGPADIHLRNRDLQVTSSTSCTASNPCTVTVASPTLYGSSISGNPTAKFSTSAGITIEPGTANQETVGTFSIASGTQLTFTPTLNHTQPYKIRQQGQIFWDGQAAGPTADPTGQWQFFALKDGNLNIWMNLPTQNGAFPLNAPQQVAIVTGGNGTNKDFVLRLNNSLSNFKVLNAANTTTLLQLGNGGNFILSGQLQAGLSGGAGGGGTSANVTIVAGSNPGLSFQNTAAGVDNKNWDILASGSDFNVRAVADNNGSAATAIDCTRSGVSITQCLFPAGIKVGTNGTLMTLTQHKRISTGSIGATTRTEVLLSWANTFTDTNYTVACNVEDSTTAAATQGLTFERIRTKSATQVGLVINNPTAGAITGTIDCVAHHD